MSVDREVFAAMKALVDADTGAGGLAQVGGANQLTAFRRDKDRDKRWGYPRADVLFFQGRHDGDSDTDHHVRGRIQVLVPRDKAFGAGDSPQNAGQLSAIIDRFMTLMDKVTLSLATHGACAMMFPTQYEGPSTSEVILWVMEFNLYTSI